MYHNVPPLSSMGGSNNLGPVMNANNTSGNGGNSNWDQSQRMRGKVRYGNRHGNTNRTSKHQQQQQQQHQGGGNMLQLGNTAGNSIPSINKSQLMQGSSPRTNRKNKKHRNNPTNNGNSSSFNASGHMGAGGSVYYDATQNDNLNTTSVQSNKGRLPSPEKQKYGSNERNSQLLPRIGSSQQSGGHRNSFGSTNTNIYRNSPTPMLTHQNSNGSLHRKISSGVSSLKGYKPSNPLNWINQDNYFVIENSQSHHGTNNIYCCLDGHGEHGHVVSKRISEILPQLLTGKGCLLPPKDASSSGSNNINYYYDYKKAFLGTQQDLVNNANTIVDAACSGATCVLVAINLNDNTVIIANAGDSRAIMGSSKRQNTNGNGVGNVMSYVATPLSYDHKPDRQDERKRVIAANGRVGCRQMTVPNTNRVSVTNANGGSSIPSMISVPVGPCRVWYNYKGDTLGLAMSRSLGDVAVHNCGVSAEPELVVYRMNNSAGGDNRSNAPHQIIDEFIVLGTDGIWDVLDNNTVVQLVVQNFVNPAVQNARNKGDSNPFPNWSATDAASFLTKTARSKWEKLSPMIDDITCIVVKLI